MQVVAAPALFAELHAALLRQLAHALQRVARAPLLPHQLCQAGAHDGVDGRAPLGGDLARLLEHILLELKHARLIRAKRGYKGGYWLDRPPEEITIADVIRAVEGPLANIHENAPEELHYPGSAERLRDVWVAVRAALRSVLENVTLAELADGSLPWRIDAILNNPEAWIKR